MDVLPEVLAAMADRTDYRARVRRQIALAGSRPRPERRREDTCLPVD
jgi:hypothetical protein